MDLKALVCFIIIFLLMGVTVENNYSFRVFGQEEMGVHNLDTGLSYASIQEAIWADETLDGHTILVDAGFYQENVLVNKSVSLLAEEGFNVIIDGGGKGTIFRVTVNDVNITGFVIQNSGMNSSYFGISLNRASGCNLRGNIVRNCYYGVRLLNSNNNIFFNNSFYNCSYGVWLAYSERNTLLNNSAFDNEHVGFHLYPSSHNILRGNKIRNNKYGIYVHSSQNNSILENFVYANEFGMWLGGSTNNIICDNYVFNNTYGIRFTACNDNRVVGNFIESNNFGISFSNSQNNFVFHNNFSNNTNQLSSANSANLFDNGMEGNYWSNYLGVDDDFDGVGDVPHVINENNTDHYPLMGKIFVFSTVLDGEEHSFYVISNCSVYWFKLMVETQMLKFRVSGLNGSVCFCRIMFPRLLLAGPYIVMVDNLEVNSTLLSYSNVSHVFLYFTFNMSNREVTVGSRPFYLLLGKYNNLLKAYENLVANYSGLLSEYSSLNTSYYDLLDSYDSLQSNLDLLEAAYNKLNSTYNDLIIRYENAKGELENIRFLMYSFLTAAVVGAAVSLVSLSFGFKYYGKFKEQRRIIESYGLSPLDVARALFELDVRKRGEKIKKFEEKYGVKIRPRASLEDIIKSLESRKERRKG